MAKRGGQRGRRTRARNLCHHFDGTELATCARPGLEVLEVGHKPVVLGGASIGCGVALDRCRQAHEPNARRWDYVFVVRDTDSGIGIEVHHTDPIGRIVAPFARSEGPVSVLGLDGRPMRFDSLGWTHF